jgi:hypothetical protein
VFRDGGTDFIRKFFGGIWISGEDVEARFSGIFFFSDDLRSAENEKINNNYLLLEQENKTIF